MPYSGHATGGLLSAGAYAGGVALFALTVGCACAAASLIVGRRLQGLTGAARLAALGLLSMIGVLVAEIVPLALTVLTRATPAITSALVLVAVRLVVGPARRVVERPVGGGWLEQVRTVEGTAARVSLALAGVGLLAAATAWIAYLELAAGVHVQSVDAMGFHLPGVIRFIQTGSLWTTAQYIPGQAQAYYPQNGDMLLLAMALPWHSLALVRYVDPVLLAVGGIALYAACRELGAPGSSAALATLALLAIRPILAPALTESLTDPAFVAGFACAILFLLRHGRTRARSDLVLAGLGLGVALGSKWYGLTALPSIIVAWLLVSLLDPGARRSLLKLLGILVGCALLTGGVWLVRNLVLTGNPIFETKVSLFGVTIFGAPPDPIKQQIGFSLAHYATKISILHRYVWPVFRDDFGIPGLLIVLACVAAPVWRPTRSSRVVMLAVAALLAAVGYAATPYGAMGHEGAPVLVSSNTRYGTPPLLLGLPLLALVVGRFARPLRLLLELVLLVVLLDDLHRYIPAGPSHVVATAAALLVVAALVAATQGRWFPPGLATTRRLVVGVGVAAVAIAFGYHYERVLSDAPYNPAEPAVDWVLAAAPPGTRIGITGIWTARGLVPVAPLFGTRLTNHVGFVGPFRDHRLEEYTSPSRFVAALNRERYPLLLVGTGIPPVAEPAQARWAQQAGYRTIVRSPRLILLGRRFS
jgi:hypothetical protein